MMNKLFVLVLLVFSSAAFGERSLVAHCRLAYPDDAVQVRVYQDGESGAYVMEIDNNGTAVRAHVRAEPMNPGTRYVEYLSGTSKVALTLDVEADGAWSFYSADTSVPSNVCIQMND